MGHSVGTSVSNVAQKLSAIEPGDPHAAEELLPLVYDELRKLAAQRMAREKPGQTLQATALVQEAYLRLVNGAKIQSWNSPGHFFAAAAEAMRRILVERARRKGSAKLGGQLGRMECLGIEPAQPGPQLDVLALNDALDDLEKSDSRAAMVVKLRYFAGLTTQEAATALRVSLATAENDWAYAKSHLRLRLANPGGEPTSEA
jgi:RNA polymerase sigma factor (TIGR02999 family)